MVHSPDKTTPEHREAFWTLIRDMLKGSKPPEFLTVENSDSFIQNKVDKWILDLLVACEGITSEQLANEETLLKQMKELPKPDLKKRACTIFSRHPSWRQPPGLG